MIRYNDDRNRFRAPTVEEILQRRGIEEQRQSLPSRIERFDINPNRYLASEAPLAEEEPVVGTEEPATESNNSAGNWFTRALDSFARVSEPSALLSEEDFKPYDQASLNNARVWNDTKQLYTYAGKEGLSVLKSKYLDELMEGPLRYMGELLLALTYVRAKNIVDTFDKNLLLEEGFTNTPAYDEYIEALNFVWQNEPTVKEIAKRNPYLRDIFYAPNSAKFPAINAGAYWRSALNEWSNNHFFDLNPFNNLEHALEDNALTKLQEDYLWNRQANNLTAEDKIKLLDDAIAENEEEYDRKTQQILNTEDVLRNGSWWFDPTMLTPEFAAKVDSSELSLTDPSSWFYNLGHLGSSYSEAMMMLGLMGTAVGAKAAAKWLVPLIAKGNPYVRSLTTLLAVGEVAGNLAFARYFRHAETASEVFDNYQLQLLNKMQDPNAKMELSSILGEYIEGLLNLDYDTDNFTDDEVFAAGLALGIVTSDPEFEKIRKDAYNGLLEIRDVNDALSWSDYLETLPFSYGGKLMWNAAKRTKAAKVLGLQISKVTTPVTQATRWARELTIDRAWNKVLDKYGTSTYMTARAIAREALAFARRTALIAASEATEEGIQYNVGYHYGKGEYDKLGDVGISGPRSFWDMGKLGLQSHLAFWGLSRDKGLNTDKDLENAMKIGGFIGIMNPLSAGSSVKSAIAMRNRLRANEPLNDLVSNGYAHAEDDIKYDAYIKALHQGKNGTYITDYLKTLKNAKGEGVTDEMIDDDIKKAQRLIDFYNFRGNDELLKDLGITRNSEDFDRYVKNYMHIVSDLDDLNDDVTTTRKRLHDLLEDSKNNKDDLFNITVKALYEQYSEAWNGANEKALAEEDKEAGMIRYKKVAETVPPQTTTTEELLTPTAQPATEQTPTIESQPAPTTESETTPITEGQKPGEELKPTLKKSEPERIAKKMVNKMTEEEFQEYIFNLVSGNEQLKALKQLKRRLNRQSKTIAELAKSTNVALNNRSVRSIINTVDKQIKRLEKQVKGQAGRIFRGGSSLEENLKGIPIKNTSEIREITAINAIETAVRDLLAAKRDAYVNGQISPENMQDVHGVFFNELDLEERDTEIARQRKDNPQKTIPEIRKDHDRAISDTLVSDKERVIPSKKLRKELGRSLIKAEISQRRQDERVAHQEKVEDGQAMPDLSYQPPTPVATPTNSATSRTSNTTSLKGALALSDEQTKPTNNTPTKPQEEGRNEKGRTNQQVPPEAGETPAGTEEKASGTSPTEGEQQAGNNPTEGQEEQPTPGGTTPPPPPTPPITPGSADSAEEEPENNGQGELQGNERTTNLPSLSEATDEEVENLENQINTFLGKAAQQPNDQQLPDDSELPHEDPDQANAEQLENLASEGDKNTENLQNTDSVDTGTAEPVEGGTPGIQDSADPNVTISTDSERVQLLRNDLSQQEDKNTLSAELTNGQVIQLDDLSKEGGAQDLNNAAVNRNEENETVSPELSRSWHFSETAFYQPSSPIAMDLTARDSNGKVVPLDFGVNGKGEKLKVKPGEELALKLLDPKWIKSKKVYYVVGTNDYYGKDKPGKSDREALPIYVVIEDEDGVYATAFRTTESIEKYLELNRLHLLPKEIDQIVEELDKLIAARRNILNAYLGADNDIVPVKVRKDISPAKVAISNGPLNSRQNKDGSPIFRKLTDVSQLGLSKENVQELDKQVHKLEFGYGQGWWHLSSFMPPLIFRLGAFKERVSAFGFGKAGAIYFVPNVSLTPNGSTVPIQLHQVKFGERIRDWQNRATVKDWEGTVPYYILQLFTNSPLDASSKLAILRFLLNHGERTYSTIKEDREIPAYSLKMFLCEELSEYSHKRFLFTRRNGNAIIRYNWDATNLSESQKVQLMLKIAEDLHFNTDKDALLQRLPRTIVELAAAYFRQNGTEKPFKLGGCDELSFTAEDIGFNSKTGKAESPISQLTWLLNTGKMTTDLGDTIYKAPYVHVSGTRIIAESTKQTSEKPESINNANTPESTKPIVAKNELPEDKNEKTTKPEGENKESAGVITYIKDTAKVKEWLKTAEGGKYSALKAGKYYIAVSPDGTLKPILRSFVDNKAGLASSERGTGKINIANAVNWLHDVLGISREDVITSTAIFRMAQIPKVYGLLRASMDAITGRNAVRLYLSEMAGEGIEYHEAFHYVSQLLLDDLLREAIYRDFVNSNKQYQNATKLEVEELLAEAFMSYMIDEKNNTLRYRVKKAFNAIKNILGLHKDGRLVDSIFYKIRGGEFAKYSPSQEIVDKFAERYNGGLYYYIPGVSEELMKNVSSITDSATFYKVVDSLFSQLIININPDNLSEIGRSIDLVFENLKSALDFGLIAENSILLTNDVLANRDVFKAQLNALLRTLSIELRNSKESQQNEDDARDSGDNNENNWEAEGYNINKKDNVALRAKMFFLQIPMMRFAFDQKTGLKTLVEDGDPIFGVARGYGFDVAWNKALDALWNVDTWVDLVREVERRAMFDPFFASLSNMLNDEEENVYSDEMLLTQILNTVKSAKNSLITLTTLLDNLEVERRGEKIISDNVNMSISDTDKFTFISRLPNKWSQMFFTSDLFTLLPDGTRVLDREKFEKFIGNRPKRGALKVNGPIGQIQRILSKPKETLTSEDYQEAKRTFITLCNNLSISMDDLSFDYLMLSQPGGTLDLDTFSKFWLSDKPDSFVSLLAKLYNSIGSATSVGKRGIASFDSVFKSKNPDAQINQMAIAWGTTHPSPETFAVLGPDGKMAYPITENHYMSDLLRWLKENKEGKRELMEENPFSRGSKILEATRLAGEDTSGIKLHTFLNGENQIHGANESYLDLSPREDYLMKMTFGLSNHLFCPTMSDRKTWHTISGLNILDKVTGVLRPLMVKEFVSSLVRNSEGMVSESQDIPRFSDHTLLLFKDYLRDELNAVRQYYATKLQVLDNPGKFVKNYYGTRKGNYADGNGGRFRYFSKLILDSTNYNVNAELAKAEYANDVGAINTVLGVVDALLNDNEACLTAINEMLVDFVDNEIENAINLGIIERGDDLLLRNKYLPINFIKNFKNIAKNNGQILFEEGQQELIDWSNNDLCYSIIASHALNTAISIIETEKAFTGDPALYKWNKQLVVYKIGDKSFVPQPLGSQTLEKWFSLNGKDGERIEEYNCYYEITNRDSDKIKRLAGVLSTGTNLRTNWSAPSPQQPSSITGVFDKFNVLQLADNFVGSDVYDTLYDAFKRAIVIDTLVATSPEDFNYNDRNTFGNEEWVKKNNPTFYELHKDLYAYAARRAKIEAKPYANGNVNQTDASAYISPRMYENILKSLGMWNNEIEEAFRIMESDDEWLSDPVKYAKAIKAITQPLKMVYFGDHFDNELGLNVNTFDKMAIFPLFKSFAKGDNKFLYDRMNNDELGAIHMVVFGEGSTVKVGSRKVLDFYKNGKPNLTELNKESNLNGNFEDGSKPGLSVYEQSLSQLRWQLNTDPHEDTERTVGTLALKVGLSNIIDDREYGTNKGLSVKGSQIKLNVFESLNNLTRLGALSVMSRFFVKDEEAGLLNIVDNKKVSKYLQEMALTAGLSAEMVRSLACAEDGSIDIPIEALSIRSWILQRIIKYVNNEVVSTTTPGGSAIQMSLFGYNTTEEHGKTSEAFNGGRKLKFLAKEGHMEVMLSENFFRYLLPKKLQDASFAEKREWLLANNIIGENSLPFGIGYRVPTQGLSSMFGFTVADILPTTIGDTIIVPDEFTAMTGSDFDVDKIYIMSYEYDVDNENNTATRTKYSGKASGRKQNVNKLIDNYMLVLTDFTNLSETRASIDTLTNILKEEILPLVEPASSYEVEPFYELSPFYQTQRKSEFADAKAGIGPFALNTTHHALTQATHLTMNYEFGNRYDLSPLDSVFGKDSYRILDWLSAMINAHVDVAKDPYIMKLNINKYTWNMASLLLRGGKGRYTFLFLAQPAIKEFVRRLRMQDCFTQRSDTKTELLILYEIGQEYFDKYLTMTQSFPDDYPYRKMFKDFHTFIDLMLLDKNWLFLENPDLEISLSLPDSLEEVIMQLLSVKGYIELYDDSKRLSQLVQFSLIDTKKFGNTIPLQINFKRRLSRFMEDNDRKFTFTVPDKNNKGDKNTLTTFFDETGLLTKLHYATTLPLRLLSRHLIEATAGFEGLFDAAADAFLGNLGDKKATQALSDVITTSLRAKAVATISNGKFNPTAERLLSMLSGNNSVVKRLALIKTALVALRKNIYGISLDGVITNALLNYLQPYTNTKRGQTFDRLVTMTGQLTSGAYYQNRLIAAFQELLDCPIATINELANLLAEYAYATSFDVRGNETFFDLVPMQWKQANGYTEAISNLLSVLNSTHPDLSSYGFDEHLLRNGIYQQMLSEIARNAYYNNVLVPPVSLRIGSSKTSDRLLGQLIIYRNARFPQGLVAHTILDLSASSLSRKLPLFVKRLLDPLDRNSIMLYQKVGELDVYKDVRDSKGNVYKVLDQTLSRAIYKFIPKFGVMDGNKLYAEYNKTGNQKSSFDKNNINVNAEALSDSNIEATILKEHPARKGESVEFEFIEDSVITDTTPLSGNAIEDNTEDTVNQASLDIDPFALNIADTPSTIYDLNSIQVGEQSINEGKPNELNNGLREELLQDIPGGEEEAPNAIAEDINGVENIESASIEGNAENIGSTDADTVWNVIKQLNPEYTEENTYKEQENPAPELELNFDEEAEKNCK